MKYANLRLLLEKETYPHEYTHKVIGTNTPTLVAEVEQLRTKYAHVNMSVSLRTSRNDRHVSYTFSWVATHPDEIIAFIEQTATLPDLIMIL